ERTTTTSRAAIPTSPDAFVTFRSSPAINGTSVPSAACNDKAVISPPAISQIHQKAQPVCERPLVEAVVNVHLLNVHKRRRAVRTDLLAAVNHCHCRRTSRTRHDPAASKVACERDQATALHESQVSTIVV